MLDVKCKLTIHFLFITDLQRLNVNSSEKLVCTCGDHPKSPINSHSSGIEGQFHYCLKNQGKILLRYDTYIYTLSKSLVFANVLFQQEDPPGLWIVSH